MKLKTALVVAVLTGMLAIAAGQAAAESLGTVSVKYDGLKYVQTASNSLRSGNFYTGQYILELDPAYMHDVEAPGSSGTGEGVLIYAQNPSNHLFVFCADVTQNAWSSFSTYDVCAPEGAPLGGGITMDANKAGDLRNLFDVYAGDLLLGTAAQKRNTAAALQAAVWEIINETSGTYALHTTDAGKGTFYMTQNSSDGGVNWLLQAEGYLTGVAGMAHPDAATSDLRVLASMGAQDYALIVVGVGDSPPIPEPITMAGLLLGVGCLTRYVRNRRAA
ncbi:MAG: hypothetical protein IMZ62_10685 [Chloroflexi bacterium]|nr:hypothetical protein [Chloroflexota bacterium]